MWAVVALASEGPTPVSNDSKEEQLKSILARLSQTAVQYRESALQFSCQERISWSARGKGGVAAFGYVFVFEEGYGFSDYRTPPRRGSRKKPLEKVEPETFGVPRYLGSAYLWIFSFRAERQGRHRYELLGEEDLNGRPALRIHFEPIAPYVPGVNDWFGTAWVERGTAQLLKLEAYTPNSWNELQKARQHENGEGPDTAQYSIERITTLFTVERNGMRFPGKVELSREQVEVSKRGSGWHATTTTLLQVNQVYSNYEFFGVEVQGQPPNPG
jgi:hypothetical protein